MDDSSACAACLTALEQLDENRRVALMANEASQRALKAKMYERDVLSTFKEGDLVLKYDNRFDHKLDKKVFGEMGRLFSDIDSI